jgi:hypothetical protein
MTHVALNLIAAAAVPNPGHGKAPLGAHGLLTILEWIAWGVFAALVASVLTNGARLAFAHNQGYGGHQHVTGLIWSLIGAVIAGSAPTIISVLS